MIVEEYVEKTKSYLDHLRERVKKQKEKRMEEWKNKETSKSNKKALI